MSERASEEKVKSVGVDNDVLCIELLNGLRLMGPLRTNPVYRDPVVPPAETLPGAGLLPAAN
ncbi:hypothetical protein [uncultured Massilia sp.]|uniref:hypothetical protein n=1 Tax=uncultured Massilia sp. TaxID=169973 RepID=UPI0025F415CD|nr:hypothetical protein [uncultured Massilia sp.]